FFEAHWNALASGADRCEGSSGDDCHAVCGEGSAGHECRAANDARAAIFPARVVAEERGMHRLQRSLLDSFWGAPTGRARRDSDPVIREIERVASGAEVLALSALTGEGMEALDVYLRPGQTAALLGSSGAGKSTLINWLLCAQVVPTQPIRESDGRGRHTTTSRQLW